MPKQLVYLAAKSPFVFLAVCFALWFAAHSFFAGIFVFLVCAAWVKKSISTAQKSEPNTNESKAESAATFVTATANAANATPQPATPIKRQYAKSAVVIPLKTGTDS